MVKSRRHRSRKRSRKRRGSGSGFVAQQAALLEAKAAKQAKEAQGKLQQAQKTFEKAGEKARGLPSHCKPGEPLASSKTCKMLAGKTQEVVKAAKKKAKTFAKVKTPMGFRGHLGGRKRRRKSRKLKKRRKSKSKRRRKNKSKRKRKRKRKSRKTKRRRKSKKRRSRKRRR